MTPAAVLETAALLGLFALAGGAYGSLYAIGRLQRRPALVRFSRFFATITIVLAGIITLATPLHLGWKLLILGSALAYAGIPPMTWRTLERLHREGEQHP